MRKLIVGLMVRLAGLAAVAVGLVVAALSPWSAAGVHADPAQTQMVTDARLPGHTIYRPAQLAADTPVLIWGEGGCVAQGSLYAGFLSAIAAKGVVVIANADPYGVALTDQDAMNAALNWAVGENNRHGSAYFGRLDAGHSVVAGWSCGGLQAYQLAVSRPEIAALGILNSGQLVVDQSQLNRLRVPTLYLLGGPLDVAYSNGTRDFAHLPATLPAFLGSSDTGHFGTYFQPHGGMYAAVLGDWIRWHIAADTHAAATFVGPRCGVCVTPGWTVVKHNIP